MKNDAKIIITIRSRGKYCDACGLVLYRQDLRKFFCMVFEETLVKDAKSSMFPDKTKRCQECLDAEVGTGEK